MFEILCDNLKRIVAKYNVLIPWYIMTSFENDLETKKYFEEKKYFNYPKEKIHFFMQGKLPILDKEGKVILSGIGQIKEASNGNGDLFKAIAKANIVEDLKLQNIKWVFVGGVDNILQKLVDPFFLGLSMEKGYQISSKSAFKQKIGDKISVFCKKGGKPSILEYTYLTEEMEKSKDKQGRDCFRDINILCHLFSIEILEKLNNIDLPYHRTFKKNAFINYEGVKEVPQKPNSFKFEKFIFDAFEKANDMLLLRVKEEEEFAPIKDFNGIYSPETATEKYIAYWKQHGKIVKKREN